MRHIAAVVTLAFMTVTMQPAEAQSRNEPMGLPGLYGPVQTYLRRTRTDYKRMATEALYAGIALKGYGGFKGIDTVNAATIIAAQDAFTGTQAQLEALVKTSADLATVWGETLPDGATFVAGAISNPARAARLLLIRHMPGMTLALVDAVQGRQTSGDAAGAFGVVLHVIKAQVGGAATSHD